MTQTKQFVPKMKPEDILPINPALVNPNLSGPAPANPNANLPILPASEAGNLARYNILPGQPGQTNELSNELRGIYSQQAAIAQQFIAQNGPGKNFTPEQVAAIMNAGKPTQTQSQAAQINNPDTTLLNSIQGSVPDIGVKAGGAAATGIITGTLSTGPAAPIVAAGASLTALLSIVTNLKSEEVQNTKIQKVTFATSQRNIKAIIDGVNKGIIDPIDAVTLYNNELAKINQVERNLRMLSEREWLSKAKDELVQIQSFNDFQRDNTRNMLQAAIFNPKAGAVLDIPIIGGEQAAEAQ